MTTEKAFPRGTFDRRRDFVVQKLILLSGTEYAPGKPFDKTLVTDRTLRQLYEQRYLRLATAEEVRPPATPPVTAPAPSRVQPRPIRPRASTATPAEV